MVRGNNMLNISTPKTDPEEIYLDSGTFPAEITLVYSNGKLVSEKIRNQETGQLYNPTE